MAARLPALGTAAAVMATAGARVIRVVVVRGWVGRVVRVVARVAAAVAFGRSSVVEDGERHRRHGRSGSGGFVGCETWWILGCAVDFYRAVDEAADLGLGIVSKNPPICESYCGMSGSNLRRSEACRCRSTSRTACGRRLAPPFVPD